MIYIFFSHHQHHQPSSLATHKAHAMLMGLVFTFWGHLFFIYHFFPLEDMTFFYFFYFLIIRVWGLWRLTLDGDPFCTAECLIFFEFYFVGVGHYLSFVFWVWRVSGPRNQLKGWLVDWIGASHDCSRLWLYTRVGSHPTWFAPCFGFKVRVFGTWICGFIFHFPF